MYNTDAQPTPSLMIDLNADLAEGCGQDDALLEIISSANICCGLHAGSASQMLHTLTIAKQRQVRIGAHPSFDDRANFGRKNMQLADDEVRAIMAYQLGATQALCDLVGVTLAYVKPHGALYNQAATDAHLADLVVESIKAFNPNLAVMGLSGGELIKAAQRQGLTTISEVFADRRYQDDGTLVPRSQANAVIDNDDEAIAQVINMVTTGTVKSVNNQTVSVQADSICLHGDGEHAILFAQKIQHAFAQQQIMIGAR